MIVLSSRQSKAHGRRPQARHTLRKGPGPPAPDADRCRWVQRLSAVQGHWGAGTRNTLRHPARMPTGAAGYSGYRRSTRLPRTQQRGAGRPARQDAGCKPAVQAVPGTAPHRCEYSVTLPQRWGRVGWGLAGTRRVSRKPAKAGGPHGCHARSDGARESAVLCATRPAWMRAVSQAAVHRAPKHAPTGRGKAQYPAPPARQDAGCKPAVQAVPGTAPHRCEYSVTLPQRWGRVGWGLAGTRRVSRNRLKPAVHTAATHAPTGRGKRSTLRHRPARMRAVSPRSRLCPGLLRIGAASVTLPQRWGRVGWGLAGTRRVSRKPAKAGGPHGCHARSDGARESAVFCATGPPGCGL